MTTATADYGTITEAGAIRFERLLPGPIERVWAYLTESEKRGAWLASGPMELREGGAYELVWNHAALTTPDDRPPARYADADGFRMVGRVLRADPPRLLVHEWNEPDGSSSEVEFALADEDGKVRLILTHRKLPSRAMMVGVAGGWHAHLSILQARLEGVAPPPFWATHGRIEPEYEDRIPAE